MNHTLKTALLVLALGISGSSLLAQDGGDASQPAPPRHRPHPPGLARMPIPAIVAALDANHDGVIDATEIANASAALQKLDKNGDGQLTRDEFMGPRPPRPMHRPPPPNGGPNDPNGGNAADLGPGGAGPDGGTADGAPLHRPPHPPVPPLVRALDANHDGIIDATEIANAPAALKALDKNGDGQLTRDEVRPPRPPQPDDGNGAPEQAPDNGPGPQN